MYAGQAVSGTGLPTGTTVTDLIDPTHILISANATANGTVTLTFAAQTEVLDTTPPWALMTAAGISPSVVALDGRQSATLLTATTAASNSQLTVASTTPVQVLWDALVAQSITPVIQIIGPGIPANTTVLSRPTDSTHVIMSANASASATVSLLLGTGVSNWVSVSGGSVVLGASPHPLPLDPNQLVQLYQLLLTVRTTAGFGIGLNVPLYIQDPDVVSDGYDYFGAVKAAINEYNGLDALPLDPVITRRKLAKEALDRSLAAAGQAAFTGQKAVGDANPEYSSTVSGPVQSGDDLVTAIGKLQQSKNSRLTILEPGGATPAINGNLPTPYQINIIVYGVDDDIRVRLDNGRVVQDTQALGHNATRYCSFLASSFGVVNGTTVFVDCLNITGPYTAGGFWFATVVWSDGTVTRYQGGGAVGVGSWWYYYANGSFQVSRGGFGNTPPTIIPEVGMIDPQVIQLGTGMRLSVVDQANGVVRIDVAPPTIIAGNPNALFTPTQTRSYCIEYSGGSNPSQGQVWTVGGSEIAAFAFVGNVVLQAYQEYAFLYAPSPPSPTVNNIVWKVT
jgi:hypothetical protein